MNSILPKVTLADGTTRHFGCIPSGGRGTLSGVQSLTAPARLTGMQLSPEVRWEWPGSATDAYHQNIDAPIYDQGPLGSCVSNALLGAFEFIDMWNPILVSLGMDTPEPHESKSRLFHYYWGRTVAGLDTNLDTGMPIWSGIQAIISLGLPPEADWPYDPLKFAETPPKQASLDADKERLLYFKWLPTRNLQLIKAMLMGKKPFFFGVGVGNDFAYYRPNPKGVLVAPPPGGIIGWHCMRSIGYSDALQAFRVANSWGTGWGENGYCWMDYNWFLDPAVSFDFWLFGEVT